jgi:hypothetical protein
MRIFKTACLLLPLLCAAAPGGIAAAQAQEADLMPPAGSAAVVRTAPETAPVPQAMPGTVPDMQPPAGLQPAPLQAAQPLPGEAPDADYPTLTMTPDKSEILSLDKPARSVIVGNPAHLAAVMDSTRRLVLIPRAPGATYFIVLGDNGEVIMQRHILVDAPQDHYVRVRKSCAFSNNGNCQTTQVYYCPGMCHEINVPAATNTGGVSQGAISADTGMTAAAAPEQAQEPPPELPQEEAPPGEDGGEAR